MRIKRILNNNAVVSLNDKLEEVVVMGSGIAFKKKSGDEISEVKIERIFSLEEPQCKNKFYELIKEVPNEYITVTEAIVKLAERRLSRKIDENIYLFLTDHIFYAVKRNEKGLQIKNRLIWEIEHFYPEEYKIGIDAVRIINENLNCKLLNNEAGFIAMHIVNTTSSEGLEEFKEELADLKSIMKIICMHFNRNISEQTIYYLRFITHLKFFLQRLKSNQSLRKINESDNLFSLVKETYANSYLCVRKIERYFNQEYGLEISNEEKMYLVLHIERIINNN